MDANAVTTPNVVLGSDIPRIVVDQLASQLDHSEKGYTAPQYKYTKLPQINGQGTAAMSGGTSLIMFNIPGDLVWNPARSFLIFDIDVTAPAAQGSVIYSDCVPIDYIQLTAASGDLITQLQNVQHYTKVVRPAMTGVEEYNSLGPAQPGSTSANAQYSTNQFLQPGSWLQQGGNLARLYVNNIDSRYITDNAAGAATVSLGPIGSPQTALLSGADVAAAIVVYNNEAFGGNTGINSANAFQVKASGTDVPNMQQGLIVGAAATALKIHCRIPLSAFTSTLLSLDKNMYFGQNLVLKINFHPLARWGFNSDITARTAAVGGGDFSPAYNALANPAQLTGVTLSNLFFWICKETNTENIVSLQNQVRSSGLQILMPWTDSDMKNMPAQAAGGSFTFSSTITPGNGVALKRVFTSAFSATDALTTICQPNNVGGVKWSSIQTLLDSRPIQDAPLTVLADTVDEPSNYLLNTLKGSVAGLSSRCYYVRNFWLDNFSDCDKSYQFNDNDNKFSGLLLSGPYYKQYDTRYVTQATQSLNFYQWRTYLRKLNITPIGVKFM